MSRPRSDEDRRRAGLLVPFAAVVLAMLPAVLDQTMLATGLPVIAGELGRISDVSWVVTAYVVAAAAATPLWGKLGDRLGRKRMLELALGGFVAASALCGAAQDMTQLIVLRLVQGTTAGGLMALAMASVGDLVSPRERGRYQGYIAATLVLAAALAVRERRAADPIVPLAMLRTRTVALVSTALFLATAALFAITVFVPLFLQTTTGATPTEAGLLLIPAMLGITISTNVSGRLIARTGRYKRFPVAGLTLMTAALAALAAVSAEPSRVATGIALAVFGLGFGMVTQVLVTAVQNAVERRELGIATATTGFFRALGGAVGAAVLGAVFAGQAGASATEGGGAGLGGVLRADVIDGVQAVFMVAAPVAALALVAVLALVEVPLRAAPGGASARPGGGAG